jgi:DNA-binding response OmpR family regulator
MDDYLAKPVRPEELAAALGRARALVDHGRRSQRPRYGSRRARSRACGSLVGTISSARW